MLYYILLLSFSLKYVVRCKQSENTRSQTGTYETGKLGVSRWGKCYWFLEGVFQTLDRLRWWLSRRNFFSGTLEHLSAAGMWAQLPINISAIEFQNPDMSCRFMWVTSSLRAWPQSWKPPGSSRINCWKWCASRVVVFFFYWWEASGLFAARFCLVSWFQSGVLLLIPRFWDIVVSHCCITLVLQEQSKVLDTMLCSLVYWRLPANNQRRALHTP